MRDLFRGYGRPDDEARSATRIDRQTSRPNERACRGTYLPRE